MYRKSKMNKMICKVASALPGNRFVLNDRNTYRSYGTLPLYIMFQRLTSMAITFHPDWIGLIIELKSDVLPYLQHQTQFHF